MCFTVPFQSLNVGDAAYNQNWFQCSRTYCLMLKLMIMRSQKPAMIRPPTFPPISLVTYMKVSGSRAELLGTVLRKCFLCR